MKKKTLLLSASILTVLTLAILWPNQSTRLTTTVLVNTSVQKAYQKMLAIDEVDDWFSAVKDARYVSETIGTAGAVRECKLEDGSIVQEQITETISNRLIRMEMTQYDLPVDYFKWEIHFTEKSSDLTEVTQVTHYQVKFGLFGALLNAMTIESSLNETFQNAYQEFKQALENNG